MTAESTASWPFHAGELQAQARAGVHGLARAVHAFVRPYLPPQHQAFYASLPFMVAAARDDGGRPWTTLLTGDPGFAHAPDPTTLQIAALPAPGDALDSALGHGDQVGLLGIELATRRRNRINGRIVSRDDHGLRVHVGQTFGNCPQYITQRTRHGVPRTTNPLPAQRTASLDDRLTRWIEGADTLFIASGNDGRADDRRTGMDASHRGGAPGFVQVRDRHTLVIPDYAGNNFFNTIGNLMVDPRAGLLFVEFETGSLLQLTGRTHIDWDSPAVALFPGARRLIVFTVDEAVTQREVLPLRWQADTASLRPLRLVTKTRDSADVSSFVFEAPDSRPLASFDAGRHLPIELRIPGQLAPVARTYSLSGPPKGGRYRITVKREALGLASRFLHDVLEPGAIVHAGEAAGDFRLEPGDRPVVLVSAGVGITPMVSMLHALVDDPRPVLFVHGARDGDHHPVADEVRQLVARRAGVRLHVSYSQPREQDVLGPDFQARGRIDGARLVALIPGLDADFYLCGPAAFVAQLQSALEEQGVAPERIHTESFGPVD